MGGLGMAVPEQNVQLAGGQAPGRGLGAGPPLEPALCKTFGAQPKALAIVEQHFEGGAPPVTKDLDRAFQGVLRQPLPAEGGQPVNAGAEIEMSTNAGDVSAPALAEVACRAIRCFPRSVGLNRRRFATRPLDKTVLKATP
jgi:hypothetical protein